MPFNVPSSDPYPMSDEEIEDDGREEAIRPLTVSPGIFDGLGGTRYILDNIRWGTSLQPVFEEINLSPPYSIGQRFLHRNINGVEITGVCKTPTRYDYTMIFLDNEQTGLHNTPAMESEIIDMVNMYRIAIEERAQSQQDRLMSDRYFEERQRRRSNEQAENYEVNEFRNSQIFINEIRRLNENLPPSKQFTHICTFCGGGTNKNTHPFVIIDDEIVCERCISNNFLKCALCRNPHKKGSFGIDISGLKICKECANRYSFTCWCCDHLGDDAHRIIPTSGDYKGMSICTNCNRDIGNLTEAYSWGNDDMTTRTETSLKLKEYCSDEQGSKVKSSRIYGIELEAVYDDIFAAAICLNKQPRALGVKHDVTMKNDNGDTGIEIVTQKLQGKKGEEFVHKICHDMRKSGFYTNKTCGYHVHLDAHDYLPLFETPDYEKIKSLMAFYVIFEDVLLSFLPRSRRKNEYCTQLRNDYRLSDIVNAQKLDDLEKAWYKSPLKTNVEQSKGTRHASRYSGINFHTFFSEKHLEVRYHSGTIDVNKVLEWVNLQCLIMDKIYNDEIPRALIVDTQEETDVKLKAIIMFDMLGLPASSREYFMARQEKFKAKVEEN